MDKYVRSKIIFTGDPELLRALRDEMQEKSEDGIISLSAVIPLEDGQDPEEVWGTSDEAEETDAILYRNDTILEFSMDTVMTPPVPVFEKLAEMNPDLDMTVNYAFEDYGERCGIYKKEEGSTELTEEEPDDPFEFACEVWDVDPEEEMQERYINEMEE